MNHPIENRYRYGLCYDLNGQIVGFNLSPNVFVGLTDEEIESALEAYVKRKHELPPVQPEQRWIPVSERLPESDEDVLVTNGIGTYVGWIDATDNGWRVDSESEYFMNDILAWMPLPEPYKEEDE